MQLGESLQQRFIEYDSVVTRSAINSALYDISSI